MAIELNDVRKPPRFTQEIYLTLINCRTYTVPFYKWGAGFIVSAVIRKIMNNDYLAIDCKTNINKFNITFLH